jgi:hypothetical protein
MRWQREEINTREVIMLKVSAVAKDSLVSLPLRPNIEVNRIAGPPNDRVYTLSI